jgi:hypothetical protein
LLLTKFEQRQDVIMLQIRSDFGLTQKALTSQSIVHEIRTDNLDSNFTSKSTPLMRQIDLAHATHIDTPYQIIITKFLQSKPLFFFYISWRSDEKKPSFSFIYLLQINTLQRIAQ